MKRFNGLPYKRELLAYTRGKLSKLFYVEQNIKGKVNQYIPIIRFKGYTECFN